MMEPGSTPDRASLPNIPPIGGSVHSKLLSHLLLLVTALSVRALALVDNGDMVGWGGGNTKSAPPQGLGPIASLALGERHTTALKNDGTIVAWGDNSQTQTRVPDNLSDVVAIQAESSHNLALKRDGTVVTWGDNRWGQITLPQNLTHVKAIATTLRYGVAIKEDGTAISWGSPDPEFARDLDTLTKLVAIALADEHAVALQEDGSMIEWLWGSLTEFNATQVLTGLGDVAAIAVGRTHTLALLKNGTVFAQGGLDAQSDVPQDLADVVAIAAGDEHSLALKNDGTVVAWGKNDSGQTTVPADLRARAIFANGSQSWALRRDTTTASLDSRSRTPRLDGFISGPVRIRDTRGRLLWQGHLDRLSDAARLQPARELLLVEHLELGRTFRTTGLR